MQAKIAILVTFLFYILRQFLFPKHLFSIISRYVAIFFLCLLAFTALFADFLSAEKPIYVVYNHKTYYPLFATQNDFDSLPNTRSGKQIWQNIADADWKHIPYEKAIWTLCPFDTKYPGKRKLQKPFSKEIIQNQTFIHYFGTDTQDIDVLASMIQGAKTSLSVGLGGLLLLSLIGLSLGGIAGYFGNTKLIFARGQQYGLFLGAFLGLFYGFYLFRFDIENAFTTQQVGQGILYLLRSFAIFFSLILFFAAVGKKMRFIPFLAKRKPIPIDTFITQLTDIQMSLPIMLLVVSLSLMLPRSIISLVLIIGFANYMGLARLVRSLTQQVRNLPYIEAAQALGFSQIRILWQHILPNILPTIITLMILNLADLILLEASFSFLNIGLPLDAVSWGKTLNQARSNPEAWWLFAFPALAIAATAASLKILGRQK